MFLDRDGVVNVDRSDYVQRWEDFEFAPGAVEGLRAVASLGLALVIATNQSCIGRGLVSRAIIDDIHARMTRTLLSQGVALAGVYCCPHSPGDGCDCRKPKPGLIVRAAGELGLDLRKSWMIGDSLRDIEAAEAAGVPERILVLTGHGRSFEEEVVRGTRAHVVADLPAAAAWIAREMASRVRATPA